MYCKMFEIAQFFSHLHFKIAKSAIMTQKIFFLKNINIGIKKTQNFMLISNLLMPAFRNAPNSDILNIHIHINSVH